MTPWPSCVTSTKLTLSSTNWTLATETWNSPWRLLKRILSLLFTWSSPKVATGSKRQSKESSQILAYSCTTTAMWTNFTKIAYSPLWSIVHIMNCHLLPLHFLLNATSSALLSSTWTTQLIWSIQQSISFCIISITSMQPRIQEMTALSSWSHFHLKINRQLTLSRSKCKMVSKVNPSFGAKRLAKFSLQRRRSPPIVNKQCVVYKFECDLCDADYVGYTARHSQKRINEHKHSVIGRHLKQHGLLKTDLDDKQFSVLKKVRLSYFWDVIH